MTSRINGERGKVPSINDTISYSTQPVTVNILFVEKPMDSIAKVYNRESSSNSKPMYDNGKKTIPQ